MGALGCYTNIYKCFFITLFKAFAPAYIIERLFWQERGVGVGGVVWCEIIYSAAVIVFEIPSGIASDRYGRKRCLTAGGLLRAVEFIALAFARGFWAFAAIIFISGIEHSLTSGSINALLYDSLLADSSSGERRDSVEKNRPLKTISRKFLPDDFEKLLGRLKAVNIIGSITAMLCGSFLARFYTLELNYYISFFSMIAAFAITATLTEPKIAAEFGGKRENIIGESGSIRKKEVFAFIGHLRKTAILLKSQPVLLLYCLTGAVSGACINYLDEFWQLLYQAAGVSVAVFGILGAAEILLQIPVSMLAYRLKDKMLDKRILSAILAVQAAGLIVLAFTKNYLCIIPSLLASAAACAAEPLITGYMHRRIGSEIRATAESAMSALLRAVSAAVGLAFGYIGDRYSIFPAFASLGVICGIYLVFFILCPVKSKTA